MGWDDIVWVVVQYMGGYYGYGEHGLRPVPEVPSPRPGHSPTDKHCTRDAFSRIEQLSYLVASIDEL